MGSCIKIISSIFLVLLLSCNVFAQIPPCPGVTVTPTNPSICSGCTTLTATVQGTVATTSYSVASIPYSPYSFNSGTSVLVNIDDTWTSTIPIPFCFEFYGNTYNQLVIGSNGIVTFDATQANGFCNWMLTSSAGIPDASLPTNSIMGIYEDIDPTNIGNTYWQVFGTAPCRAFVISFYKIPYYGDPNSVNSSICNNATFATYQIVLYETTNIIDINVQNKQGCTSWNGGLAIEGIQDANAVNAVSVAGRNNTVFTASNDAYRFTPTGAPQYTLTWYAPPNTAIGTANTVSVCPTVNTTYTATVVNNTCNGPLTVSAMATVTIGAGVVTTTTTPTSCSGNTGTATAIPGGGTAPFTYSWNTAPPQNTQTATGLGAGTYTVTVTDATGCSGTQTVTVASSSGLAATATVVANVSCNGGNNGSATSTPNGGTAPYTYHWSNGQNIQNITGLAAGNYSVSVTDANGCVATSNIVITEPPAMNLTSATTSDTCGRKQGSASVTAAGGANPYTYIWLTNPIQSNSTATALAGGTYTCIVTDANGCTTIASAVVGNIPGPLANFTASPQVVDILDANVNFIDLSSNATTWLWDFGDGPPPSTQENPSHVYQNEGTYTVTLVVTNADGCVDTTRQIVTVEGYSTFYVPNTFTPNGDGKNDFFGPLYTRIDNDHFSMMIFDRWGNLIFQTTKLSEGWDGKVQHGQSGKVVEEDVYVYVINYRDIQEKDHKLIGNVNVIK